MLRAKPISGDLLELQREIQGYADEFGHLRIDGLLVGNAGEPLCRFHQKLQDLLVEDKC